MLLITLLRCKKFSREVLVMLSNVIFRSLTRLNVLPKVAFRIHIKFIMLPKMAFR
jgi:hypothetical protein